MRRAIGILALAVLVAGCSGEAADSADPSQDAAEPSAQPTDGESGADAAADTTEAPEPTDATRDDLLALDDEVGAVDDLRNFTCGADDAGVWNASGEVRNPTDEDQTYYVRIGVIELDDSRSSLAFANVVIDVDAEATKDFVAESLVTTRQEGLGCVSRVVRGEPETSD